ncbi:sodium:solute symporter family transporter [Cellvibrio mixtus]|uniref:sodium:solute symporter family transporter n=1 Tax=Cellvibrio mixtus TaxID=39650 RepID=UPI000586C4DB|nr:sodium/solute symporter [Cellvibrio mixtus]
MINSLNWLDLSILALYAMVLIFIAYYVSREKAGHQKNAEDYFLASKSLPWWAVGTSLIAANISAEQIVGMSGAGYAAGIAIASYEWMSAITLFIVGKYFLPIFMAKGIYTMPQFLENRYDRRVRIVMSIFWLTLYVLVNLTSILYLGALAIEAVTGVEMTYAMIGLAVFSFTYSIYGGMKAVAFTDVFQVTLLVLGGLLITYLGLEKIGGDQGIVHGFTTLLETVPEKFDLILDPSNPQYQNLPGISVLIGGMWVMNMSYWGFNQYITQRTLAAKSLQEAQKGIALAAYLKVLMPIIVVLPGVAAASLIPGLSPSDRAYPEMMKLLPHGLLGIVFASLVAAICASLSSKVNSISTLFTMDIYKLIIKPSASEAHLVNVGRIAATISLIIALVVAKPLIGKSDQAFQFIQDFTAYFTPGIVLMFLFGFFWKKATATSALVAGISSILLSIAFKEFYPGLPFMDRVGLVFVICAVLAVIVTYAAGGKDQEKAIDLSGINFKTEPVYNAACVGVVVILVAFYSIWW